MVKVFLKVALRNFLVYREIEEATLILKISTSLRRLKLQKIS